MTLKKVFCTNTQYILFGQNCVFIFLVVSPVHYVPASFLQYGSAAYAPPASNALSNRGDDTVRVDSASVRGLTPPRVETRKSSPIRPLQQQQRFSGYSNRNKEYLPPKNDYLPPKNDYLPPKNDYLPPKREEVKSPAEYLPPKNDYLPPTTAAPAPAPAPEIIWKYIEPGFTFGEYPLSLVPIVETKAATRAESSSSNSHGGYN